MKKTAITELRNVWDASVSGPLLRPMTHEPPRAGVGAPRANPASQFAHPPAESSILPSCAE